MDKFELIFFEKYHQSDHCYRGGSRSRSAKKTFNLNTLINNQLSPLDAFADKLTHYKCIHNPKHFKLRSFVAYNTLSVNRTLDPAYNEFGYN